MTKISIYILLAILLLTSCKKAAERKCWKKKGEVISEIRDLDSFSKLHLSGGIFYRLIQDSLDYVEIRGGENLVGFIETKVENGELMISDNNNCNFLRKLPNESEVDIHFTSLNSVFNISHNRIEGTICKPNGFLYWDNWDGATEIDLALDCDTVQIALHTGSPSFRGHGKANVGYLYTSGNGHSDGSNLLILNGQAHNAGVGDIRINVVNGLLNCVLESGGDIYYTGDPSELMINDDGIGRVIPF